jgi:hypothetical protein
MNKGRCSGIKDETQILVKNERIERRNERKKERNATLMRHEEGYLVRYSNKG